MEGQGRFAQALVNNERVAVEDGAKESKRSSLEPPGLAARGQCGESWLSLTGRGSGAA